jgi:hypothetical protein
LLLTLSLSPSLPARTWTDKDGRSIEAEIVSADGLQVTVNKGGKEFKLPLDRLSDKDQEFVKTWAEEQKDKEKAADTAEDAPGAAAAGGLTFDGKPLVAGGKTNLFEYDYSPEQLANTKKVKGNPTYKAEYAPPVAASLKKNGMSKVRAELHQGKNSLDYGQFAVALKWFAAQE